MEKVSLNRKIRFSCVFLGLLILGIGCQVRSGDKGKIPGQIVTVISLEHLTPAKAGEILVALQLGFVHLDSEPNIVRISGTISEQKKATIVLDLMDRDQDYVVVSLGPASVIRFLPSNGQIARMVGDISLGTFTDPPPKDAAVAGLLDIHGDQVTLIVPAGYEQKVRQAIALGQILQNAPMPVQPSQSTAVESPVSEPLPPSESGNSMAPTGQIVEQEPMVQEPMVMIPEEGLDVFDGNTFPQSDPNTVRGVLKPFAYVDDRLSTHQAVSSPQLPNGDDVLELELPEQMKLIELLDLAGEYLDLDYVYDEAAVGNQVITLRLHGKHEGQLRLRDLYTVLEMTLRFKGLVMVRREGNLVSIVPEEKALYANPKLVTSEDGEIDTGDMVVTRVFKLEYIDVASVAALLQNMQLSVAVSHVVKTQMLFVTCYAHRMSRIEQLVRMVDQPGQVKEFRFRQLQYTRANTLVNKILDLIADFRDVKTSFTKTIDGTNRRKVRQNSRPELPAEEQADMAPQVKTLSAEVYLDTDERTNRLFMIGTTVQLDLVEQIIDILDVAQQDLRVMRIYLIKHLKAQVAAEKLKQLGVIGVVTSDTSRIESNEEPVPTPHDPVKDIEDQAQVTVLEATNCLLINATRQQHQRVQDLLKYIDTMVKDHCILRVYPIKNVDAAEVLQKLIELAITSGHKATVTRPSNSVSRSGSNVRVPTTGTMAPSGSSDNVKRPRTNELDPGIEMVQLPSQVVVLESTNSLLVDAPQYQHQKIAAIISLVDVETVRESIPYVVYFLENQSPEHLAGVLSKIVEKTTIDEEGKVINKKPRNADDEIVFVPDELTFSLVVYANRKNQEWIKVLIEQLDREQAQVLIDVTLVEISKTDEFNLDLNLISGIPDMLATSGLMDSVSGTITTADIMDRMQSANRDRFIDMQSKSGVGNAFYGDEQVMLLMQAMDEKKYGRILAKPKVLVNDNETGSIITTDTTYVKTTKQSALPGNTEAVITSEEFTPYDAGITLDIVPHINEDNLLRLNISMRRSDFIASGGEKPPDQSSSDLKTVVTIPDGSTIILGGMLKLNQSKGATKVPGLGDLPLLGILFRSTNQSDLQKRLYIFVKAEIIRPSAALADKEWDLERISNENRAAFEVMEKRFQDFQLWPGVKPNITEPNQVLETR